MSIDDVLVELDGVSAVYPREDVIEALFRKVAEECLDSGVSLDAAINRLRCSMLLRPNFTIKTAFSACAGVVRIFSEDGRELRLESWAKTGFWDHGNHGVEKLIGETIVGVSTGVETVIATNIRYLALGDRFSAFLNDEPIKQPFSFLDANE